MPNALAYIIGKIDNIETMLSAEKTIGNEKDRWMNIDDLREYHPDHPAKPTILFLDLATHHPIPQKREKAAIP